MFLKSLYIHTNFLGTISDLLMILAFFALIQVLLRKMSLWLKYIFSVIIICIMAIWICVLTVGALYIKYVAKTKVGSELLFGNELQAV